MTEETRKDTKRAERVARATRTKAPLTVGEGAKFVGLRTIKPAELKLIGIDEHYQRAEIKDHVNQIIAALERGGQVIDPITLAQRKDGSLWVVDGQQRYWAHWHLSREIQAIVYEVDGIDSERRMFSVLNSHRRPNAGVRIRAWVGPAGDLIRWLHESSESPIRSEVSFTGGGRYPATTMMRGMLAVLGGYGAGGGNAEDMLRTLDILVRDASPAIARKAAQFYVLGLRQIFGDGNVALALPSIAIGIVCHEHWKAGWKIENISKRAISTLSRVRWERYAPTGGGQWLDNLKTLVLKQWPLQRRRNEQGNSHED